jgi:uncharacterized phage protein gp47/JayE
MAGLSDTGFTTKRLPEVVTEDKARAVTVFQDQIEPGDSVNTDDSSVIGRLVALAAPSEADLWEAAQQVYSAFDANSATGISLDNMILLSGIPARFENTYTTAQVILSGDTGTVITAGNTVSSPTTSEQFTLLNDVTLSAENTSGVTITSVLVSDSSLYTLSFTRQAATQIISFTSPVGATKAIILAGIKSQIDSTYPELVTSYTTNGDLKIVLADIFLQTTFATSDNLGIIKVDKLGDVVAVTAGPLSQPVNTITQIQTSRLGWDSVTNPLAAVSGRLRETDEELRIRFRNTKFERAGNIVEAVYSALFSLDDVQQVYIDDNNTDVTNANGTPGHSFLVLVDGGTSVEIARAIWDNRGAGVASVGNTTVTITDKFGYEREIKFSRPTPVNIYIQLELTTDQNFPENGEDLIREAIINYVDGLSIGQDVLYSRLYTPVNSIPGHQVDSMLIGTTNPPVTMTNVVIPFDGVGQVLPENITFI